MRREIGDGYELDDDPSRVDIDVVHTFLANDSYWAKGRARDIVEQLVKSATRVIGLYKDDEQVGFARVVSDNVSFGWLGDVFVLPDHRGRGLGVELVGEAIDGHPSQPRNWFLGTLDAHGLYRKFGFHTPSERIMQRKNWE